MQFIDICPCDNFVHQLEAVLSMSKIAILVALEYRVSYHFFISSAVSFQALKSSQRLRLSAGWNGISTREVSNSWCTIFDNSAIGTHYLVGCQAALLLQSLQSEREVVPTFLVLNIIIFLLKKKAMKLFTQSIFPGNFALILRGIWLFHIQFLKPNSLC